MSCASRNTSRSTKNNYFTNLENIVETNKVEFGIRSYRVEFDKSEPREFEANYTDGGPPDIPERRCRIGCTNCCLVPGVQVYYSGMDTGMEKRNDHKSRHHLRLVGDDSRQLEEVGEMLRPVLKTCRGALA